MENDKILYDKEGLIKLTIIWYKDVHKNAYIYIDTTEISNTWEITIYDLCFHSMT